MFLLGLAFLGIIDGGRSWGSVGVSWLWIPLDFYLLCTGYILSFRRCLFVSFASTSVILLSLVLQFHGLWLSLLLIVVVGR